MKPLIFLYNYTVWLTIPFITAIIISTFFNVSYLQFVQSEEFIIVYTLVEFIIFVVLACDVKNFQFIKDNY